MKFNTIFKTKLYALTLVVLMIIGGCSSQSSTDTNRQNLDYAENNDGLTLPEGFKAVKVAEGLGNARHITVADNGDIYVAMRRDSDKGGVAALRDTDGDGVADQTKYFGEHRGTGIGLHDGYLYVSSTTEIYRYKMGDELVPAGDPELIAEEIPEQGQHASKAFTFDNLGNIYVNVGAPSNSCQENDRGVESPGQDPCPLLERYAGIWQFSASEQGQTQQEDGVRYATGLRNVVGLDWKDSEDVLYVMQHGRDNLYQNWSEYYTKEESAELPAEELFRVNKGNDFGWPYTYYDQNKDAIMLAPEYGGDGEQTIEGTKYEGQFEQPVTAFPGHWAPNALQFYDADQFPEKYRGGAFVAFHGSWNRAPEPQAGYKVSFVPFENDTASDSHQDFATGFPGVEKPQPATAEHRPTGLALGPDGSLYITDDSGGTVWRIVYQGDAE